MPTSQAYLRTWLVSTLTILAAVSIFNLLVDPYGLFRVVNLDGFNRIKSQAAQRAEMFKRHNAERLLPRALILGNSRAEIGFDPDSPVWPATARPVANLALPGTGIDVALDQLHRAVNNSPPTLILLGVDFIDFRAYPATHDGAPPSRPHPLRAFRERISALLTFDAIIDSIATIKAQREKYPASLTEAGFNPMRDYAGIARREGYYKMFRQRSQENAKAYVRGPKSIYASDGRPAREFRALEEIIALANQRSITVHVVMYPYHAHTLVLFHQAGLWPAFEEWKRELVKLVESSKSAGRVELWDFSGFSAYAEEPVPLPGDNRSELRWYWEVGHFKKALGDVVLARIFEEQAGPQHWGLKLTPENVEDTLRHQRFALDSYKHRHAPEVADLERHIAAARSKVDSPRGVTSLPPSGEVANVTR